MATAGFIGGPLEMWAGDPRAAELELRENCEQYEEANDWVERARDWASEGPADELSHVGDAWADVAEVNALAGRKKDAVDAARQATAWYQRKGNVADAALVRHSR